MSVLLNKCVSCHDAFGVFIAGLSKRIVAVHVIYLHFSFLYAHMLPLQI